MKHASQSLKRQDKFAAIVGMMYIAINFEELTRLISKAIQIVLK